METKIRICWVELGIFSTLSAAAMTIQEQTGFTFYQQNTKRTAPDEALKKHQRKQNNSHCNIHKLDYLCYIQKIRFSLRFLDFCLFLPLHLSDLFNSMKGFVGTGRKSGNWRSSQQSLQVAVVCTCALWSRSVRETLFHLLKGSSTLNLQDKHSNCPCLPRGYAATFNLQNSMGFPVVHPLIS